METETLPRCPVVHHGVMSPEPECRDGSEWFCMECGRRLYRTPPAPLKLDRADLLGPGELRTWVKKLLADNFTTGAIAEIVNRDHQWIGNLVREIKREG